ncbi:MAG TPA: GTP pyrophosphokinase, partial [Paludibacteraceae bacterium]|nr:GTP pyrophosphokinase [Paludibacteraceae bacterium]
FPATIEIKGIDRMGMLSQIVKVISDEHSVNVNKVNLETKDGIFEGRITIYVHDVEDVNNLSMNLLKIKGVNSVNRVELTD